MEHNEHFFDDSSAFEESDKEFKFKNEYDYKVYHEYDYFDSGIAFAALSEDYFFGKILLNYWLLIDKVEMNKLIFENGMKIYFKISPIDSNYFELILGNITYTPKLLYRNIMHKNYVLNEIDKSINAIIRYCHFIYKIICIKFYYLVLHQQ